MKIVSNSRREETVDIYERMTKGECYHGVMRGEALILRILSTQERNENKKINPDFGSLDVKFAHTCGVCRIFDAKPFELTSRQVLEKEALYYRKQKFQFNTTHNGQSYIVGRKFASPINLLIADMGNKKINYKFASAPIDSRKNHYICVPLQGETPLWGDAMQMSKDTFHKFCKITSKTEEMLKKIKVKKSKRKNQDGAIYRIVARIVDKDNGFMTLGYMVSFYDRQQKKWVERPFNNQRIKDELLRNNIRNAKVIQGNGEQSVRNVLGFELTYGNIPSLPTYYLATPKKSNNNG